MKQSHIAGIARCLVVAALLLTVAVANGAAAAIYDFYLPENGEVGAFRVQVLMDDATILDGGRIFQLNDEEVLSYSLPVPIDPNSLIGIDIRETETLIGIALFPPDSQTFNPVLLTDEFPDDFFVFGRAPLQSGTFSSTGGLLTSTYALDTPSPTATLVVSDVPEPGTWLLLSLGLFGIGATRRLRRVRRERAS